MSIQKSKPKELFFALVTPSGSDKEIVIDILAEKLKKSGYYIEKIKLSKSLDMLGKLSLKGYESDYEDDHFKRIDGLMTAGTDCRKRMERGDALTLLAIANVITKRSKKYTKNKEDKNKYVAYLFDSLKHPKELETLRLIYGDALTVISIYTLREKRIRNYAKLFAGCTGESKAERYRNKAEELITRDAKEQGEEGQDKYGQQVRKTFPLADLFVETSSHSTVKESINRYIDTLLGYPYHTPNIDEYGMAMAVTSTVRSADLSRQVGVSIVSKSGELITTGCNDVPKYGGGLYWPGQPDHRDFQRGHDSGAKIKNEALQDILTRYIDYLESDQKVNVDLSQIKKMLLDNTEQKKLAKAMSGTLVRNILEFGRSVHAEMAALTEAALRGVSVKNATLYTTTFPCHLCARHIISAGIARVVYIEPFPKSLSGDLYSDSIVVDPSHEINDRVLFEPFVGISPWHYHNFFKSGKRKNDDSGDVLTPEMFRYRFFDREWGYRNLELYAISKYLDEKQYSQDSDIEFVDEFKKILTNILADTTKSILKYIKEKKEKENTENTENIIFTCLRDLLDTNEAQ